MRVLLIALLAAISYAQTGYAESGVYRHCSAPQHFELGSNCDHTILSGTTCDLHFICPENMFSNPVPRTCQEDSTWTGEPLDPNCHDIECPEQEGYQMFETGGCSGHDKLGIYFESLDECAHRCENEDSCVSFEYSKVWDNHPEPHRCALSATCTYDFSRQALNDQNCLYVKGIDVPANDATQSGSSGNSKFPYIHCPIPEHFSSTCDGTILLGTTCELFFLCPERRFSYRTPQVCQEDSTWHGEPLDPNCYDTEEPTVNPTQNPSRSEQITTTSIDDDVSVDLQESDKSDESTGNMIKQICVYLFAAIGILATIYCCLKFNKSKRTSEDDKIAKPQDSPEGNIHINAVGLEYQYHDKHQEGAYIAVNTQGHGTQHRTMEGVDSFVSMDKTPSYSQNELELAILGTANYGENTQDQDLRHYVTPEGPYRTGTVGLPVEIEGEREKFDDDGTLACYSPTVCTGTPACYSPTVSTGTLALNSPTVSTNTSMDVSPCQNVEHFSIDKLQHKPEAREDLSPTTTMAHHRRAKSENDGKSGSRSTDLNFSQNDVAHQRSKSQPGRNRFSPRAATIPETKEDPSPTATVALHRHARAKSENDGKSGSRSTDPNFSQNDVAHHRSASQPSRDPLGFFSSIFTRRNTPGKSAPAAGSRRSQRQEASEKNFYQEEKIQEDPSTTTTMALHRRARAKSENNGKSGSRSTNLHFSQNDVAHHRSKSQPGRNHFSHRAATMDTLHTSEKYFISLRSQTSFEEVESSFEEGNAPVVDGFDEPNKIQSFQTPSFGEVSPPVSGDEFDEPIKIQSFRSPSFGDAHLLFEQTSPPSVRPLPTAPSSSVTANTSPRAHTSRNSQGKAEKHFEI